MKEAVSKIVTAQRKAAVDFSKEKERILVAERCVLYDLDFNLEQRHHYEVVTTLLHEHRAALGLESEEALREVRQLSINFINGCMGTTLCIQYDPITVGAGIISLAREIYGLGPSLQLVCNLWELTYRDVSHVMFQVISIFDSEDRIEDYRGLRLSPPQDDKQHDAEHNNGNGADGGGDNGGDGGEVRKREDDGGEDESNGKRPRNAKIEEDGDASA